MSDGLDAALRRTDGWGASHISAAVVGPAGVIARRGERRHRYRLASVTKLLTAWSVLVEVDRGRLSLDESAGPPGSTIRHLLAHASGLPFEGDAPMAAPGRRRIYSNPAYDLLGSLVADATGTTFAAALRDGILGPLGMDRTRLVDRASQGLEGPIDDLAAFAGELLRPRLVTPATGSLATTVAFPGLAGVVPGVGNFDPCDWGLGPELHDGKAAHWMGTGNGPGTFGHFGGSGTFLWVDPLADVALVVLCDRGFGPWALDAWPALSDAVLAALG